jgi:hypothetical protein
MSQDNIGANQTPKSKIPGCFFGFLAAFIGGLGMLLILVHKTHHVAHLKRFKSHSLNGVCRTA